MRREGESCARSSVFFMGPDAGQRAAWQLAGGGWRYVRPSTGPRWGAPGGLPPSLAGPVRAAARLPDALARMVNLSSVLWNCEDDDAASQIAKNFAEVLSPAESRLNVD